MWKVARVTGLEPATSGVTGRRSNQLSYTRVFWRGGDLGGAFGSVNHRRLHFLPFVLFFLIQVADMIDRAMILVAKAWQKGPSQILPPSCRYQPSCSAYAITAIERYGAARGGWMALKRILRCHPWGGQGYDPVP